MKFFVNFRPKGFKEVAHDLRFPKSITKANPEAASEAAPEVALEATPNGRKLSNPGP